MVLFKEKHLFCVRKTHVYCDTLTVVATFSSSNLLVSIPPRFSGLKVHNLSYSPFALSGRKTTRPQSPSL